MLHLLIKLCYVTFGWPVLSFYVTEYCATFYCASSVLRCLVLCPATLHHFGLYCLQYVMFCRLSTTFCSLHYTACHLTVYHVILNWSGLGVVMSCDVMPCCVTRCGAMLYCIMLYQELLCCIIFYCVTLYGNLSHLNLYQVIIYWLS